jgi:hypothetical protein
MVQGVFTEAPPPKKALEYQRSIDLGLLPFLRVEDSRDMYRCAQCHAMQRPKSPQVWVTEGVSMGDPVWSIAEASRQSAYNGHASAWCLSCARKLSQPRTIPTWVQVGIVVTLIAAFAEWCWAL